LVPSIFWQQFELLVVARFNSLGVRLRFTAERLDWSHSESRYWSGNETCRHDAT